MQSLGLIPLSHLWPLYRRTRARMRMVWAPRLLPTVPEEPEDSDDDGHESPPCETQESKIPHVGWNSSNGTVMWRTDGPSILSPPQTPTHLIRSEKHVHRSRTSSSESARWWRRLTVRRLRWTRGSAAKGRKRSCSPRRANGRAPHHRGDSSPEPFLQRSAAMTTSVVLRHGESQQPCHCYGRERSPEIREKKKRSRLLSITTALRKALCASVPQKGVSCPHGGAADREYPASSSCRRRRDTPTCGCSPRSPLDAFITAYNLTKQPPPYRAFLGLPASYKRRDKSHRRRYSM